MAGDIPEMTLGRVLSFANGKTSPERNEDDKYPVYGSNGIIGYTDKTNSNENTIIIGRVGSYCGSVYFSKDRCWVTDNAIRSTANNGHDAGFLYYLLTALNLNNWRSGSGQPLLNQATLRSIRAKIPPLHRQKSIAHILGTLDDKIELNRRMNETLEAMAQALFRAWFVDFEPVKAKQAAVSLGRDPERAAMATLSGKLRVPRDPAALNAEALDAAEAAFDPLSEVQRTRLSETAALFPDQLEESDLGMIPEGWTITSLEDVCRLNPKSWSASRAPDSVRYVDLSNTNQGEISAVQEYSWNDAPSRARRILTPGDTIVGTVRPGNRAFALIPRHSEGLTGSTGFAVLSPVTPAHREFVYLAVSSDANIERLALLADGAAYPAVRPSIVADFELAIPGAEVLGQFSHAAAPLIDLMEANRNQRGKLTALRDTLLPELLSGAFPIPDQEECY